MSCSFVGGLSGLHTYFTSRNKSTYEHFRSRAGSQENPYNVNCARNWQQVLRLAPVHGMACMLADRDSAVQESPQPCGTLAIAS